MKVIRLSALSTSTLSAGTYFCWRLSGLQGRNAAGSVKSMKNLNPWLGLWHSDSTNCTTTYLILHANSY